VPNGCDTSNYFGPGDGLDIFLRKMLGDKQRHIDGEAHVGYLKEVGIKAVHVHQPHDTQNKYHDLPYVEGAKYEGKE
jgi:hypothetical protein